MSDLIPAGRVPSELEIDRLTAALLSLPQTECPLTHHFADGIYGREMFAPAGTVIAGKRHRFATLNILLLGRIQVTGADGAVREMVAPCVFVSPPGTRKVGHVLEDVRWLNVLPTKLTDLAAIEQKFIEPETHMIEVSP